VLCRDIWPKDLVGNTSNDVTGILNIYCKYLSEEHSGMEMIKESSKEWLGSGVIDSGLVFRSVCINSE